MRANRWGDPVVGVNINTATSGNTTLVSAVSGRKIVIVSLLLIASGTVSVTFTSGAGGTDLIGDIDLVAQTGFALAPADMGWQETATGQALVLNLDGNVNVGGSLSYFLE